MATMNQDYCEAATIIFEQYLDSLRPLILALSGFTVTVDRMSGT